ncbi:uncharacterized protein SPSK_00883 [Sporothrix schenckii 1099-18]|uniref:Protein kinase domain-containing protein n=1 Tax=Sporothrix schenckii 1099-18 TaxID=1397361 RepID=A0A0F2LYL5_SPOSC|nr:uncharacterized protein SPSK_00883 [Sporothrix schenckii 1099-18]KJR81585.1 hypothetical protein SPSK_00883 [Sporothrix schenckii 1099-18]
MGRRDSDSEDFDEPVITYPRMVQFRLGLSRIHAKADLLNSVFPHVLHLTIVPRRWYGLVRRCTAWLPVTFQAVVHRLWPGAFLPARVVLKKLSRPTQCRTELFNNEIAIYTRLRAIQGKIIPNFYGEASVREDTGERKRAIVLSVVDGELASRQTVPIPMEEFKRRLGVAHAEMLRHGVAYDDVQLNNLVLQEDSSGDGGGRIVFLDLEYAFPSEPEEAERRARALVTDYGYLYRDCLMTWQNRQRDGW